MVGFEAILVTLAAAAIAPAGAAKGEAMADRKHPERMAPARDGDIAILQELCQARGEKTVQALDAFIVRHPRHPLADIARREREWLARGAQGSKR